MKLFLGVLLFSFGLQAATLDREIKKLQESVDVGTNGGSAEIVSYDVKTFSYKPLIGEIYKQIKAGGNCGYAMVTGRTQVLKSNFDILTKEAEEILVRLDQLGYLKAAIGYNWPGDQGDSEYCSREELHLYFTNGKALIISFDSTT